MDCGTSTFSEDYSRNNPNMAAVEQMVLRDIRDLLQSMGKDIRSFDLPELNDTGNVFSSKIILKKYCVVKYKILIVNLDVNTTTI